MREINRKKIEVYADWVGLSQPILAGFLYATLSRGKEMFSFEYDHKWLSEYQDFSIDPSLQLFHNTQYLNSNQENFGVFMDSSPDRWGRVIMDRREAQMARAENREERSLLESDYLLGVYDENRMGALRFRTDPTGPFLDCNKAVAAPPWASLRELEHACLELEKNDSDTNPNYSQWLQMLIAPGGSLGGARPKASVVDENQHLWIAKFPSGHDSFDIGGWEMVAHKLAKLAKIDVADAKAQKFNSNHHTFINKRFDRNELGERIHFASAMTLLQRSDGDDASKGASYLELANFIKKEGAHPIADLEQLWRRIVFFICISNVDDHLRNHGFIFTPKGWILSPAFDMNPVARGHGLKLNISETDNSQDLSLAYNVAKYFRVDSIRAEKIIHEVVTSVQGWRNAADSLKLSTKEQNIMSKAFRIAEGLDTGGKS